MAVSLASVRPVGLRAPCLARPSARPARVSAVVVRAESTAEKSPLEALRAPAVGLMAAALLATSAMVVPDAAEAKSSGGRMGGSGFSRAKSSAPARSSTTTQATAAAAPTTTVNNTTVVVAPPAPMFGIPMFGGFGYHPFGFGMGFGMPFGGVSFFFQIAITLMVLSFVVGLLANSKKEY